MSMNGSCLCGAVRYQCATAPVISGNCHCKDCQKASGSAYTPAFFVHESAVTVQGELKHYESRGDSGGKVRRFFCPNCGSQVYAEIESIPGVLAIRAGTLDDTSQYRPELDIFVNRAAPWDFISPTAKTFEEMPPPRA